MLYENTYLKGNIIGIHPLNNFYYHFINLGFTFICRLLHIFGLSSWCFPSIRRSFRFIKSFLSWMSHWLLCSLWINSSPWYGFSCAICHIGSLRVNHNIINCSIITVWKTSQVWQVLLLGRPPWPYSMLIIGWWYSGPEQRLQGH